MKNSILIVDEAHNIQEVCNDAVSKDFDTKAIEFKNFFGRKPDWGVGDER